MKRHHSSVPWHKRLTREGRLQVAPRWISSYPGRKLTKGYQKHFGVDLECTLTELAALGMHLDVAYVQQLRQSEAARVQSRRRRRQEKIEANRGIWLGGAEVWFGMDWGIPIPLCARDQGRRKLLRRRTRGGRFICRV